MGGREGNKAVTEMDQSCPRNDEAAAVPHEGAEFWKRNVKSLRLLLTLLLGNYCSLTKMDVILKNNAKLDDV